MHFDAFYTQNSALDDLVFNDIKCLNNDLRKSVGKKLDRKMAQLSPTPKSGTEIIGHCRIGSAIHALNVVTLLSDAS